MPHVTTRLPEETIALSNIRANTLKAPRNFIIAQAVHIGLLALAPHFSKARVHAATERARRAIKYRKTETAFESIRRAALHTSPEA